MISSFHVRLSSLCLTACLTAPVAAQAPAENKVDLDCLRDLGVEPTRDGIAALLKTMGDGTRGRLSDADADAVIAQLGSDEFEVREKAAKRLLTLLIPPIDKLRAATTSKDAEIASRSKAILQQLTSRPDPLAAVFRIVRQRKIRLDLPGLLDVVSNCDGAAREAGQDAIVGLVAQADLPLIQRWLNDKRPRIQAVGIRALGAVLKSDAVPDLQKYLTHKDGELRAAAAIALVEGGKTTDLKRFATILDAESYVLVLRAADRRFRQQHRDDRIKPEVANEYHQLTELYADALTKSADVKREKKPRCNDVYWINLGLDTSKHPEVLMYRIRWFGGDWSAWLVPGFNDREVGKGRDIRLWACFNDHEFEIVTTTRKDKQREVQDLP